jgi:hypothetical protein
MRHHDVCSKFAPKKLRLVKLSRGAELSRLILDTLRKGEDKPLTTVEIAAAMGYSAEVMPALIWRVRAKPIRLWSFYRGE